jgi:hypothetical protein
MQKTNLSRRRFLKQTSAGAVAATMLSKSLVAGTTDFTNAPAVDKKRLVAALADTIIPTADGYPGYRHLEQYGITDEVLKSLQGVSQQDWNTFNAAAGEFFNGKSFLDLTEDERTNFLSFIVDSFPPETFGTGFGEPSKNTTGQLAAKLDAKVVKTLQNVFRLTRTQVLLTFYKNFPENRVPRDKNGLPLLPPGDQHQIINPNTPELVTGWDVAGFPGPLSWEEEEARRAKWMKIRWSKD